MQYYNQSYYLYGTAPPILWATPTMISDLLSLYELHIAGKKKKTPPASHLRLHLILRKGFYWRRKMYK